VMQREYPAPWDSFREQQLLSCKVKILRKNRRLIACGTFVGSITIQMCYARSIQDQSMLVHPQHLCPGVSAPIPPHHATVDIHARMDKQRQRE